MAIQLAASAACQVLTSNNTYIKLFSDSQAALKSLIKFKVTSKSVARAITTLNELGESRERMELNWIKAHNNYTGNERADKLALNSAYHNIVNFSIDPPFSTVKKFLNNMLTTECDKEWGKDDTCRMTKLFYPTVHNSTELCELGRETSRRFIEIITGQSNLNYIKNKIKGTNLLCRLYEEEETFDHFLAECPCLWQTRRKHFGLGSFLGSHAWGIKNLLKFADVQSV